MGVTGGLRETHGAGASAGARTVGGDAGRAGGAVRRRTARHMDGYPARLADGVWRNVGGHIAAGRMGDAQSARLSVAGGRPASVAASRDNDAGRTQHTGGDLIVDADA